MTDDSLPDDEISPTEFEDSLHEDTDDHDSDDSDEYNVELEALYPNFRNHPYQVERERVEPLYLAMTQLLRHLQRNPRSVQDEEDVLALTRMKDSAWWYFVDPSVSEFRIPGNPTIALTKFGNYVGQLARVDGRWQVIREPLGPLPPSVPQYDRDYWATKDFPRRELAVLERLYEEERSTELAVHSMEKDTSDIDSQRTASLRRILDFIEASVSEISKLQETLQDFYAELRRIGER